MMENAGRNLAMRAIEMLSETGKDAKIVVLAGGGGNGGGGICAARHLAYRGFNVGLLITKPDSLSEAAARQQHIYRSTAGQVIEYAKLQDEKPALIVDALIGYGLAGPPRGVIRELICWANSQNANILSLDIPSGIDSSTGEGAGDHFRATSTLTLALPKTGLVNPSSGELFLGDIGIPAEAFKLAGIDYNSPFGGAFTIPLRRTSVS